MKFSPAPAVGPRMKYSRVHSFKIMLPRSLSVGAFLFSLYANSDFAAKNEHPLNVLEVVLISSEVAYKTTWFPEPLLASKEKLANNSCKDHLDKKQRG